MTINWRVVIVVSILTLAYLFAGTSDFHSAQGLVWP